MFNTVLRILKRRSEERFRSVERNKVSGAGGDLNTAPVQSKKGKADSDSDESEGASSEEEHTVPPAIGDCPKGVCRFVWHNVRCPFKRKCAFRHCTRGEYNGEKGCKRGARSDERKTPCYFFARGECNRGKDCRFSHDKEKTKGPNGYEDPVVDSKRSNSRKGKRAAAANATSAVALVKTPFAPTEVSLVPVMPNGESE